MNVELTTQTKFKSLEINNNFYNRLSILFIGICNVFKKWFKLGKKVKPIETPIPTNMVTPTPTVIPLPMYREVLLSNPPGESTAKNCCTITTGLPKYIDYTVEISAGLVIYNDIALTERTYITNPYGNKYAMIYDPTGANGVNGGKRFSVKFDSNGIVNNHIDCITKIPKPTPTITLTSAPSYREIQLGSPTTSSSIDACGITSGSIKYIAYTREISVNLVINNNTSLTEKTYNSDPGNWSMLYDITGANGVNGGKRYAVQFDNQGLINNIVDCTNNLPPSLKAIPQIAYEYEAIRCGDELKIKIIANNPNLKQNVYSLSQENINTCYKIVSEPIEINGIGSTYYLIGNCNDNRCAQL